MKRSRRKDLKQELNLTNMIDIVFAILIVFILCAPLMSQGVKVNLPQVKAPTMEQQKLLKVSITKNLEIFIADMQVDMESFESIFKSLWNGEMGHQFGRSSKLRLCDEGCDAGTKARCNEARFLDNDSKRRTGK